MTRKTISVVAILLIVGSLQPVLAKGPRATLDRLGCGDGAMARVIEGEWFCWNPPALLVDGFSSGDFPQVAITSSFGRSDPVFPTFSEYRDVKVDGVWFNPQQSSIGIFGGSLWFANNVNTTAEATITWDADDNPNSDTRDLNKDLRGYQGVRVHVESTNSGFIEVVILSGNGVDYSSSIFVSADGSVFLPFDAGWSPALTADALADVDALQLVLNPALAPEYDIAIDKIEIE